MKHKRLLYYALFFVGFIGFSFSFSQIIPFLTELGYSASERGYILSFSALVGIIAQFVFGIVCDRMQKTKPMLILSILILMGSAAVTYQLKNPLFSVMLLWASFTVGFFRTSSNLLETWVYTIDEDTRQHFGTIRVFGSIGWALGSFVLGFLIRYFGYSVISWASLPMTLIALALIFPLGDSDYQDASQSFSFQDLSLLVKNRQFVLVLLVFFFLFLVYNMDMITVIDYMLTLDAGSEIIGFKWSLQAVVELPLMIAGWRLLTKYGLKNIVVFASISLMIRFIGIGLTNQIWLILAFSSLQLIFFPLILLSQKEAVNQQVPAHLRASGHLLMTSVTSNIPVILMPLISSWASNIMDLSTLILLGGVSVIFPILLMLFYKEPSIDES
ncbi:MAG TPA: MFS transporter [Erysipelothrix sp.]|nr:MFS transporter [Erysipelothrix sp.]